MEDGWLLKGVQDLVDQIKSLERERSEAAAEIEALERENSRMAALIAEVSAVVSVALEGRATVSMSQPAEREELKGLTSLAEPKVALNPPAESTARAQLEKSSAHPKKGLRDHLVGLPVLTRAGVSNLLRLPHSNSSAPDGHSSA
jgi:hypothetical protein